MVECGMGWSLTREVYLMVKFIEVDLVMVKRTDYK
jgi:hypothetical protein